MARLNVILVSVLQRLDGQDLPAILEADAHRCQPEPVRSMLLFAVGNLMRALDGEASEVRHAVQQILANPHCQNSVVLNEERVDNPSFACTSLGTLQLPPDVILRVPPRVSLFTLTEGAVAQRVRAGLARNLLKQFACDYA